MSSQSSSNSLKVTLVNSNEYDLIRPAIMEQLLSNKGRMLFPRPKYQFFGLDPTAEYRMSLRFDSISDKPYSYNSQTEKFKEIKGTSTELTKSAIFTHPSNIQLGRKWMEKGVEFSVKVRNRRSHEGSDAILLKSLHKYQSVLIVQKVVSDKFGVFQIVETPKEFTFDCLQFITCTSYKSKIIRDFKATRNKYSARDRMINRPKKLKSGCSTSYSSACSDYLEMNTPSSTLQITNNEFTSQLVPIPNHFESSTSAIPPSDQSYHQPTHNSMMPINSTFPIYPVPNNSNTNQYLTFAPTQLNYPCHSYYDQNQPSAYYPVPVDPYHDYQQATYPIQQWQQPSENYPMTAINSYSTQFHSYYNFPQF